MNWRYASVPPAPPSHAMAADASAAYPNGNCATLEWPERLEKGPRGGSAAVDFSHDPYDSP
jgi:hypothetical protein